MALKTYVLLDHMKPTAPVYVQVNANQKVRVETIPLWKPYLQITFLDEREKVIDFNSANTKTFGKEIENPFKGKNRTARLKLNSNTPWQDEQIKNELIPANEKFTQEEYDAAKFIHNVCITDNPAVQRYLENIPDMEGFKGRCNAIPRPSYKVYDKTVEIKNENVSFKRRLEGANKIADLELDDAIDLIIRIYGSAYTPLPTTIEEAQNVLVQFMDGSDEALDEILNTEITVDDEVNVLIGRLVAEGKISFDAVEGKVVKKKGEEWIPLRDISNEYEPLQRQKYFVEFLNSPAGKLMLDDLKKEVVKVDKEELTK